MLFVDQLSDILLACLLIECVFGFRLQTVKSALNSNDEVILRTIYDDLLCTLRSHREVSTEGHSRAIRSSSSFLGRNVCAH